MGVLEGRVAIVTGAAGGIGAATSKRFAEEGAAVVLTDIRGDRVIELAKEFEQAGGRAIGIGCDLAVETEITAVVDLTIRTYGQVDVLANIGQGGMDRHRYLEDTRTEDALLTYTTGPLQTMLFMQKCLPHMKARHYGRIINVASHSAILGLPGFAPYEMAKGSIQALTRNASQEWGKYGIVTNLFLPGIKTPAFDMSDQGREQAELLATQIPVGRFGNPYEDCTPMVLFLASEGAGHINGQSIGIDGGKTMIA
ncbi:NAD(P)-dependent dehydrogenase (short-subunit alcohol dehydrogenase family) [Nakamurella sp. UYEF19]|uniref:SDR family NAD(P)-dependent oxidoreductase n=1 Tax=Nakamurella sp. UYEF19 TaxID=1756392 RepID=UPI003395CE96